MQISHDVQTYQPLLINCLDVAIKRCVFKASSVAELTVPLRTFFYPHSSTCLLILEGKGGGERGRETSIHCLPHAPQPGTEPITEACALTRKQPTTFHSFRKVLHPPEPHRPGHYLNLSRQHLCREKRNRKALERSRSCLYPKHPCQDVKEQEGPQIGNESALCCLVGSLSLRALSFHTEVSVVMGTGLRGGSDLWLTLPTTKSTCKDSPSSISFDGFLQSAFEKLYPL